MSEKTPFQILNERGQLIPNNPDAGLESLPVSHYIRENIQLHARVRELTAEVDRLKMVILDACGGHLTGCLGENNQAGAKLPDEGPIPDDYYLKP